MKDTMPTVGEVRKGTEVGFKSHGKYIWVACAECRKERWVYLSNSKGNYLCCGCALKKRWQGPFGKYYRGPKNHMWQGGRTHNGSGYIRIWVSPNDFYYPMADKKSYVLEHRLVMAKSLSRNLHSWEIVHHKNHIKGDNRIENLQLVSDDRHQQITILENKIKRLEDEVKDLKYGRQVYNREN